MKKSRKAKLKEHTIWNRPELEFRPFLEITQRTFVRIGEQVFKQINHVVHFEIEDKTKAPKEEKGMPNSGLDCSGQGECQPGVTPSDGDEMQSFLVKANRKPACKRNQAQRKKSKKEAKIN